MPADDEANSGSADDDSDGRTDEEEDGAAAVEARPFEQEESCRGPIQWETFWIEFWIEKGSRFLFYSCICLLISH